MFVIGRTGNASFARPFTRLYLLYISRCIEPIVNRLSKLWGKYNIFIIEVLNGFCTIIYNPLSVMAICL